MPLSGAALSPSQMAFYTVAATVIPVFMLGYLVGMATLARATSRRLDQLGDTLHRAVVRHVEAEFAQLRKSRIGRSFAALYRFLLRWSFTGVGRRLVAPLVVLAVGVPVAGEIAAFRALARDRADHQTLVITSVGLSVSGVIVLAPALYTLLVLYVPFTAAIDEALLSVDTPQPRDRPAA